MKNSSFLLLLFVFCLYSCIKEEVLPCSDQYKIQLYIEDKNYVNQPVDENLPFSQSIGEIYYVLHHMDTGDDMDEQYTILDSGEKEYTLQFTNIPNGRYLLSVWGNLPDTTIVDHMRINLHPEQQESADIYFAADTFVFTSDRQSALMGMERVNGKLRISCKNFPDTISRVDIKVIGLYQHHEGEDQYAGSTELHKSVSLADMQKGISASSVNISDFMHEVLLAPTVAGISSRFSLSVFGIDNVYPVFKSAIIDLVIKANEITDIEINFNDLENIWEIWMLIDGKWERVYHLVIA